MNKSIPRSDSLIGSLCREIEHVRNRYKVLNSYLINSKDKGLKERLKKEINKILLRRLEISNISETLIKGIDSGIASLLLYELSHRPLVKAKNNI